MFRNYNPALGRYMESDPIGLAGGINTYNYAANNPYKYVDPLGLVTNPLEAACVAGPNLVCLAGVAADAVTSIGAVMAVGGTVAVGTAVIMNNDAGDTTTGSSDADKAAGAATEGPAEDQGSEPPEPDCEDGNCDDSESKRHSPEKEALTEIAKELKKTGAKREDIDALKELNEGLPDPYPEKSIRVDEGHATGASHSQVPHGHAGNVDHIPIKDP